MPDLSDLADHIDEQAQKSQATSADGVSVQRRSLKDLDDHYDRQAARQAAADPAATFRLMNAKIVAPGGH